jgi:hypothetical protein
MCPSHLDDFLTGFPSRFLCSSLLCHPNVCRVFSMTLSFAERFEWGSLSKECLPLRGNFRSKLSQIVSFGPAAPSRYSRRDFGPSNCFFRVSSAFKIFEARLWSLKLFLSGRQCLQDIRGETLVPRIVSFGPAAPSRYSRRGFGPSNCPF